MLTVVGDTGVPVVLGFNEVGEDVVPRPAVVPHLSPVVVVAPVPPHIQHVIEDRGSSQDPSSWPPTPPVDQSEAGCFLRLGLVRPVDRSHLQRGRGQRNVAQDRLRPTGL